MDPDGAQWTMRLYGPGALNVVGTGGDVFTRGTGTLQESIDTITVAGANSTSTRLVATVFPNPENQNAKVFFQNLIVSATGELGKIDPGQVSNFNTVQNGILAVDMPNFYLAHTETAKPTTPSRIHTDPGALPSGAFSAGQIFIPEGVITLRFGGVDVNYVPDGGQALNTTGQNNEFEIQLGLPVVQGTSIIVNTVNSTGQINPSTTSPFPPSFQDYATFLVTGRLNLFQANEIDGNTASGLEPTQFSNTQISPFTASPGGTFLISQGGPPSGENPVTLQDIASIPGQIGDVRIGGPATNLTTYVLETERDAALTEGEADAKVSNFYIGGQTNNVLLVAPSGARNVAFGLGMDNVTISASSIATLRANRDALNSTVTISRSIQNLLVGGDVQNTLVNVGERQSFVHFLGNSNPNTPNPLSGSAGNFSGVFFGEPMPSVGNPALNGFTNQIEPVAQNGGTMQARIAGSVINSVFSASVDPDPTQTTGNGFGTKLDLILPRGVINAKVEGNISNTGPIGPGGGNLVDPNSTGRAFFAKSVKLIHGPIIPPTVPYQPFAPPTKYNVGQNGLKGLFKIDHIPAITRHKSKKK
jgi:hypothetical protein